MSSIHGTIRRYQLIIEKVSRQGYPSMAELMDYLCDQGFENSQRTIQRDIETIRYEFGVELTYNRAKNGYFVPAESKVYIDQFLRLANLSQVMEMMAQPAKEGRSKLGNVLFDAPSDLRGLEYLSPLLRAIEMGRKVNIRHTSFYRGESTTYEVLPYLMKEYDKRWYLVGWVCERGEFRSFGVDRIDELKVTDEPFRREDHPDPVQFFKDIVGITYSLSEVEEVELAFEPFQGNYLKTLPLHESQVVLVDNEQEFRVRLHVRLNFELRQKILSYGQLVKVLKPANFAEEIADNLRQNLKQYD